MTVNVYPQEVTYIEHLLGLPAIKKEIYYTKTGQEAMAQLRKDRPDVTVIGAGRLFSELSKS